MLTACVALVCCVVIARGVWLAGNLRRLRMKAKRLVALTKEDFHPRSAQAWAREELSRELERG